MRTFRAHLQQKLEDSQFKDLFEEEKALVQLDPEVAEGRAKLGISQTELAKRASVTQQQVSKIENGINCNLLTLLKVCRVLRLTCRLNSSD